MPVLGRQFQFVFPELFSQIDFVSKVVKEEEEKFLITIDKGFHFFNFIVSKGQIENEQQLKEIENLHAEDGTLTILAGHSTYNMNVISGKSIFILYDRYGFPLDLIKLIAAEKNLKVDEAGFEQEMQQQKTRSRAATAINSEDWVITDEDTFSEFVGYDTLEIKSKVLKYRKVTPKGKEAYQLVLNATPFYAESGGQVGDKGELIFPNEIINVFDTKKENNLIIHFIEKLPENINNELIARVNETIRRNTEVHHSATHLLHAALREVLGTHVAQKGSLVNAEHLRFDFSHFAKVTDDEIAKIEAIVNEKIRENVPVVIKEMSKDEAIELGATALFGEKYGDIVRVVIIDPTYSIELCGGTHVSNTGELGYFKIKHETAVAAGVRRIEAVSGKAAEDLINENFSVLQDIKESLKNPKDVTKAIENLQSENADLKKKIESFEAKFLKLQEPELLSKITAVNGTAFLGKIVETSSEDALKKFRFDLLKKVNGVILLCTTINSKPIVVLALSDILVNKGFSAKKIINQYIGPLIKGGGDGNDSFAAAGGRDNSKLSEVIEKVKSLL